MSRSTNNQSQKSPHPPKWPDLLLSWVCASHLQEEIIGDLHERFYLRVARVGEKKARRHYLLEALAYLQPSFIKRNPTINPNYTYTGMLHNYIKVSLRNLLRYKSFSFINIFGLAVAMSVCMLIILMLADQKRYDQFHVNKDRTYRILSKLESNAMPNAATLYPLASTLQTDYPVIEESATLLMGVGGDATYHRKAAEMRGYFAGAAFFKVFSYPLEKGDRETALSSPHSMVITSALARKLFNSDDPIGKTVEFTDRKLHHLKSDHASLPVEWGTFTITAVLADTPYKSHLNFDVLVSSASLPALIREKKLENLADNWWNFRCYTYVLLTSQDKEQELQVSLNDLVSRKGEQLKHLHGFKLTGQKLTDITPGIMVSAPPTYSLPIEAYYFLAFLGLAIMLSACLNYTNLSIARALTRAKEIGVRKVNGANRKDLIFQFLSESVLTAFFSLVLAIVLLTFIKPAFKNLWVNTYLHFELGENIAVYVAFAVFALCIGIVAGAYPALHLSRFQPAKVLKNLENLRPGKMGMRKVLSMFQFVISLFFITTSILIYKQFNHHLELEYGFSSNNIVNIELQSNDYRKVVKEFSSLAGVSGISASDYVPATGGGGGIGIRQAGSEKEHFRFFQLLANEQFIDNLGIKLLAGRNLPAPHNSPERYVLLNKRGVQQLGYQYPAQAVGQLIEMDGSKETLEIVGVVEDFRSRMPTEEDNIGPLVIGNKPELFRYVQVQLSSSDLKGMIAKLESKWKTVDPIHPFKYEFYDEQLAATNQGLVDVVSILGFIAFLAITIACLGLLGMVTYTAERRMKEVGIRKVLGAESTGIAFLLSKGYIKILAISVCIGTPLSYFANNLWLENFPNRVNFGIGTLLTGIVTLLLLGCITIASQTIRASKSKPINYLRVD